jgi:hypothetical protein
MDSPLLPRTPRNLFLYSFSAFLTTWASLYVWQNRTPHYIIEAVAFVILLLLPIALLLFGTASTTANRILSSSWFWIFCIVLFTAYDVVRYPASIHTPSTVAPALIEPAKQLLHGHDPYSAHLQHNIPISPGPGWILLLAPLTLAGGVMLISPIFAAICTYLIRKRTKLGAGIFMLLLLLEPDLVLKSSRGHDIFAISIAFAILCLLAERLSKTTGGILLLSTLAALFATSRIPMVALLVILGIGLYRLRKRAGALFLMASLALTTAIHAIFFLWAAHDHEFYQPLHLFARASRFSGHALMLTGFVAALLVFAWIVFRMTNSPTDWMIAGGMFLAAAFIPIGIGELIADRYSFTLWEGSNYVSFAVPLFLAALALTCSKSHPNRTSVSQT